MGAAKFVLSAIAWSLGLFALLRFPYIEAQVVAPATAWQAAAAVYVFGAAASPIQATLACSGSDAIALCLGAILAYPVAWRRRWRGALGGLALIVGLNITRIGTLGRAAADAAWFNALHLYIWPAVLTLAIAGYVFAWMQVAGRAATALPIAASGEPGPAWRRFVVLSVVLLVIFVIAAPNYLDNPAALSVAAFITRAAAATLSAFGATAHASGHVLSTSHGAYRVTVECVATPLIPIFVAAVIAWLTSWRWRILGLLVAGPLFVVLGIARVLVVALPIAAVSPAFLVHAFFQLLTAVTIVFAAAVWRERGVIALRRGLSGNVAGALLIIALSALSARLTAYPAFAPVNDPQGAIAFLPAFQMGFFIALWIAAFAGLGWRRFAVGVAALGLLQVALLLALHAMATHAGFAVDVRAIRGLALAGPILIAALVTDRGRAHR